MRRKESKRLPMKLQFFAEPAPEPADPKPTEISLDDVFSKFSVDDILARSEVEKAIQSRVDSTVTKALNTARAKWDKEQLENLDESKRLEKMNEEQRAKYQLDKDKKAFEAEKKQFEHEQLVVSTGKELLNRGLDADFAKYLVGADAESTQARIDSFEQLFNSAVTKATNTKMKGNPPKDPEKKSTLTMDAIKEMTPAEINARWDEVQDVLSGK